LIEPETIVGVILAAGLSTRFGADKVLHVLDGKPLGAHIADTMGSLPLAARFAVCPARARGRIELFEARGYGIISNPNPAAGMGASLKLAAERAMALEADALIICLADMPYVTAEHLRTLVEATVGRPAAATRVAGHITPPAVFRRPMLEQLMRLSGDHGARDLLVGARLVEADQHMARDFDTPEDFARGD
jgi:molybdenum cofactor cytidylyltransferase